MNKQRDVLKVPGVLQGDFTGASFRDAAQLMGRVKKLLKSQQDMGQVGEPALLCCVSSLEVFVKDLARKLKAQAAATGTDSQTLTPIELKRAVEDSSELAFLHAKVAEIDESAVKYHKAPQRKGKRVAAASASKRPTKKTAVEKAGAKLTVRNDRVGHDLEPIKSALQQAEAPSEAALGRSDTALVIDEDDDYDESDSD